MKIIAPDIIECAQNCQRDYKLLSSVQLAQWADESAWGTKCSGKYNFFGVKAKQGTITWTHEYIDGKYTAIQQIFANYNSPQDAFDEHAELLIEPEGRYQKALPFLNDFSQYIKAIGPIYSTSPDYATNLLNLIYVENFQKYDIF